MDSECRYKESGPYKVANLVTLLAHSSLCGADVCEGLICAVILQDKSPQCGTDSNSTWGIFSINNLLFIDSWSRRGKYGSSQRSPERMCLVVSLRWKLRWEGHAPSLCLYLQSLGGRSCMWHQGGTLQWKNTYILTCIRLWQWLEELRRTEELTKYQLLFLQTKQTFLLLYCIYSYVKFACRKRLYHKLRKIALNSLHRTV